MTTKNGKKEENIFSDEYFYKALEDFSMLPPPEYAFYTPKDKQQKNRKLGYKDNMLLCKLRDKIEKEYTRACTKSKSTYSTHFSVKNIVTKTHIEQDMDKPRKLIKENGVVPFTQKTLITT